MSDQSTVKFLDQWKDLYRDDFQTFMGFVVTIGMCLTALVFVVWMEVLR